MSYVDAPATRLLATHCICCHRPLVDAKSVELCIGPDCRAKYGYEVDVSPEMHARANAIIHQIATTEPDTTTLMGCCTELALIGFTGLAGKIGEKAAPIKVAFEGSNVILDSPFRPEALPALRAIPGRWWDGKRKVNTFPVGQKARVWQFLKVFYPGMAGRAPDGAFFVVPTGERAAA